MSIEALARRERYAFFGSLREAYAARYILTAHHRGDQAETILLNIIK
jgi:tRNA(Ile)-lysidine synthase